jgi:hypothetical protein
MHASSVQPHLHACTRKHLDLVTITYHHTMRRVADPTMHLYKYKYIKYPPVSFVYLVNNINIIYICTELI